MSVLGQLFKTDSCVGRTRHVSHRIHPRISVLLSPSAINRMSQMTRPVRHHFTLSIGEIRKLKDLGVISAAPENRMVIQDDRRIHGTCEGYWNSLRKGYNSGQMLGYSLDDCAVFAGVITSGDFAGRTVFVTDFGHRFAWLTRPAADIVFEDGNSLLTLNEADREYMMSTKVAISVTTHSDKAFLKDFIKDEYLKVNTTSTPLEGGELARGLAENPSRLGAEAAAKALINTHYAHTPRERDNHRLLELGLVSAGAKGSDHFHRKVTGDSDLLTVAAEPLTISESAIATSALSAWNQAETTLKATLTHAPSAELAAAAADVQRARATRDAAGRGEKAAAAAALKETEKRWKLLVKLDKEEAKLKTDQVKILESRAMDHANCGPILYGFREAVVQDTARNDGRSTEVDNAKTVFLRWMEMSLASKAVWSANRKDVATRYGENNSARYYNEARSKAGWTRMKTMVTSA
jgi:hypothetical protein